MKMHPISRELY